MNSFTRAMTKAAELTRAGRLDEAMALIRSLVQPAAAPPATAAGDQGEVIEGSYRRIGPDGSLKPAAKPAVKPKAKRSPLSETLRKIADGGMPAPTRKQGVAPDLVLGAQFLTLTHKGAQGSRGYRLYVPAHRPEGLMPLVLMLHGCTQTAEDFAAGTGMNALAEDMGVLVAYPAQPSGANVQKCWNWFRPEDQGRGGEPALIAGLTRDILRDFPADPARVFVAGLSAGGAAAAIMGAAYPELYAAVGVHSGLAVGAARDVGSAFAAMQGGGAGKPHGVAVPTIVFQGQADATVHPSNGALVLAQALAAMPGLRSRQQAGVSEGGRAWRATAHLRADGLALAELWEIEGAGHAWAGGSDKGSYTDPRGPDASRQMLRFFLSHRKA